MNNVADGAVSNNRQATSTVLKVFGWLWCVGLAITAIALLISGSFLPAITDALSAFFAAPPSWRLLARNGIYATRRLQIIAVVMPYVVGTALAVATHARPFGIAEPQNEATATRNVAVPATERQSTATTHVLSKAKQVSNAHMLKTMKGKIADFALQPLDPKYDLEGYAKLGKGVWRVSNDLRLWAGVAALQSDSCKAVSSIAVWEGATRSHLSWHVVCSEERFVISEAQALSARARFDPETTDADQQTAPPVQALSAQFDNFNSGTALRNCEAAMKEAAVNKRSFATSGVPYFSKNDELGQVTLDGEFSASNAYGGTLSAKYHCVVRVVDASVVGLVTSDALGLHTVID